MWPVLLSLGRFELRTLSVFMVLGLLLMAFVFWKRMRDEHYDEAVAFDGFLSALFVGFIAARIGFILFHWSSFGGQWWLWLDIVSRPGLQMEIGVLAAAWNMSRFAKLHKWDVWEVLDCWLPGLCLGLTMVWIGMFWDGSGFGTATQLPVGLVFPSVFEKHHPVQLYFAGFFFVLFTLLSWLENHYRTFNWYKGSRNTSQSGLVSAFFMMLVAVWSAGLVFIRPAQLEILGVQLDLVFYILLFIAGLVTLWVRSGRSLGWKRR